MSVCKLTSPVLEMWSHYVRSRVPFLERWSLFEQHGHRAYVAECFAVTAFALELGNDVKYLTKVREVQLLSSHRGN